MGQDASNDELEYESGGESDGPDMSCVLNVDSHLSELDSGTNVEYRELWENTAPWNRALNGGLSQVLRV